MSSAPNCAHITGTWGNHDIPYLAHLPVEAVSLIESRITDAGVTVEIDHDKLSPLARAYLHANPEREGELCEEIAVAACHAWNMRQLKQPLQS